ncbi:hypothetical protein GQ457_04G006880 [Hibiscus cannabinus]
MERMVSKSFTQVRYWRRRRRMRMTARSGGGRSVAMKMKVKRLQKLVPGGKGMQADRLFLRTADYILHLQSQIHILQALAKFYQPSASV